MWYMIFDVFLPSEHESIIYFLLYLGFTLSKQKRSYFCENVYWIVQNDKNKKEIKPELICQYVLIIIIVELKKGPDTGCFQNKLHA